MRKPLLLLLLLLAFAIPAEARWYQIELIVFARNDPRAGATEYWPEDPGTPSLAGAQPLLRRAGAGQAFARLPGSELQLERLYGGLVASHGRYEPLLHLAWRQPVGGDRDALPVHLTTDPGDSPSPPRLEGTFTLTRNRYLHADLDLVLRRLERRPPGADRDTREDPSRQSPHHQAYRMHDHRRMRSGELHYLDHPLMGVLVLVIPYGPGDTP
jgi:hypothetical protein